MSVLSRNRTVSKAEFVNTAIKICNLVFHILLKLSARYQRLFAEGTAKIAGELQDNAEKANSIFPNTEAKKEMRRTRLLEAKAALNALDVRLTQIARVIFTNPQGAFTTGKNKPIPPAEAARKLDKLCQTLGELIDKESALLQGAIKALDK